MSSSMPPRQGVTTFFQVADAVQAIEFPLRPLREIHVLENHTSTQIQLVFLHPIGGIGASA